MSPDNRLREPRKQQDCLEVEADFVASSFDTGKGLEGLESRYHVRIWLLLRCNVSVLLGAEM